METPGRSRGNAICSDLGVKIRQLGSCSFICAIILINMNKEHFLLLLLAL